MILKFDDYIQLNETVANVSFQELKKTLEPLGYEISRSKGDDGFKIVTPDSKNTVYGHLKHGNSKDENRKIDPNTLDLVRQYMIDAFKESGNLTPIKSIDWKHWALTNPLDRELRDYNPETGEKIEKEKEKKLDEKMAQARLNKSISTANEKFKDAALWKIDYKDENSAFIIMITDKHGNSIYNTCRSEEDRRPLHKEWFTSTNYEEREDGYYFGKDDMRSFKTKFYKVELDGSLRKKYSYIKESLDVKKFDEIF